MNNEKILLRLLKEYKSLPVKKIVEKMKEYGIETNKRSIRKLKQVLVREGHLIGASNCRGYYLINNQEELDVAVSEFVSHAVAMLNQSNQLTKNYNKKYGNQQLLLFRVSDNNQVEEMA